MSLGLVFQTMHLMNPHGRLVTMKLVRMIYQDLVYLIYLLYSLMLYVYHIMMFIERTLSL